MVMSKTKEVIQKCPVTRKMRTFFVPVKGDNLFMTSPSQRRRQEIRQSINHFLAQSQTVKEKT